MASPTTRCHSRVRCAGCIRPPSGRRSCPPGRTRGSTLSTRGSRRFAIPDTSTGVIALPPTRGYGSAQRAGAARCIAATYSRGTSPWSGNSRATFRTSVGYVGTQTVHQMLDIDINAAPPGGGPAGRPLAATQNRRISMLMWDGSASGNYHSLQVGINRQFSHGLLLKGAYTWSKAINWTDEDGWTGAPQFNWGPVQSP